MTNGASEAGFLIAAPSSQLCGRDEGWFREEVLDAMLAADAVEYVQPVAAPSGR